MTVLKTVLITILGHLRGSYVPSMVDVRPSQVLRSLSPVGNRNTSLNTV